MTVHHPQEPQSRQPQEPQSRQPQDPMGVTPTDPTGTTDDRVAGTTLGTDGAAAPATTASSDGASQGTSQVAKDEAAHVSGTAKQQAGNVADTAKGAARDVADTAKGEARQVVGEAKQQASQLFDQTMHEVRDQAKTQQSRAADGMRTFGDDLHGMTENTDASLATQLVGEVAQRVTGAAEWLEHREPADLLAEVKSFARRKPGTFIAIAGVAGLVVGRLARGLMADAKDEHDGGSGRGVGGRARTAGESGLADPFAVETPRANEPAWQNERPLTGVEGADAALRSSDQSVNGYPGARREGGL